MDDKNLLEVLKELYSYPLFKDFTLQINWYNFDCTTNRTYSYNGALKDFLVLGNYSNFHYVALSKLFRFSIHVIGRNIVVDYYMTHKEWLDCRCK